MATPTANFNLQKPTVGGDANIWGNYLNDNFDIIDQALEDDRFYVGDLKFSAQTADHGRWLLCDGRAVSRATYNQLYDFLVTLTPSLPYGNGDGTTTFNLPNSQGLVLGAIGQQSGTSLRTLGQKVGEENHTLTVNELPAHTHEAYERDPGVVTPTDTFQTIVSNANGTIIGTAVTQPAGGGQGHNTMQPTLFVGNVFIYYGD